MLCNLQGLGPVVERFQANCSRQASDDGTTITFSCEANKPIASQECLLNNKMIVDCKLPVKCDQQIMLCLCIGKLPLVIAVSDLEVGSNSLQIVISDANGATSTYQATLQITPTGEYTAGDVLSYC